MAEWAMRLTPEPFRDFLPYVSRSALKVVHSRKVLQHALTIVKHSGSESERARAAGILAAAMGRVGSPVHIATSPVAGLDLAGLSAETRVAIGSRVLGFYFHQLQGQAPWFLDLRPRHFAWDDEQRSLSFYPSALWYEPSADFRRRVRSLYAGFYRDDRAVLSEGLELYSWGSSPAADFPRRFELLLREHFGAGDQRDMRFSIAHFRATFDRIFVEMARSNARLHPELTFLGVGLVGLYLTLEQLSAPLDVRRVFEDVTAIHGGTEAA